MICSIVQFDPQHSRKSLSLWRILDIISYGDARRDGIEGPEWRLAGMFDRGTPRIEHSPLTIRSTSFSFVPSKIDCVPLLPLAINGRWRGASDQSFAYSVIVSVAVGCAPNKTPPIGFCNVRFTVLLGSGVPSSMMGTSAVAEVFLLENTSRPATGI